MCQMKKIKLKLFCHIFTLSVIITVSGCASLAMTAGGVVASAGVEHSLSGIAQKTFTASIDDVHSATLRGLEHMNIAVTDMNETKPGWKIKGTTDTRNIDVELEKITSNATRMQVIVTKHDDIFFKDSSTATEIIVQTAHLMD